jgi:hypothetical protein
MSREAFLSMGALRNHVGHPAADLNEYPNRTERIAARVMRARIARLQHGCACPRQTARVQYANPHFPARKSVRHVSIMNSMFHCMHAMEHLMHAMAHPLHGMEDVMHAMEHSMHGTEHPMHGMGQPVHRMMP